MAELKDVFVPGGMPSYTYQDRKSLQLEQSLLNAVNRLRKFIAVAGPTKCGKTVLVRKVIPKATNIWIEGAHVSSIDSLWDAVLASLGVASPTTQTKSKSLDEMNEFESSAGFKPGGIGAEVKGKEGSKSTTTNSQTNSVQLSKAQSAVEALLRARHTLVIDDFHYIDQDIQTALIRALKQAVFDGLSVVLILIPHRMHQAASAEMDVDGRTQTINIPEWQRRLLSNEV